MEIRIWISELLLIISFIGSPLPHITLILDHHGVVKFVLVAQTPTEANKIIVSSCYLFFFN